MIIGQESSLPPPHQPALSCAPQSHDSAVCTRAGDAAKDDVIAAALAVVTKRDDVKYMIQPQLISPPCLACMSFHFAIQVKSAGWSLLSVNLSSGQVAQQQQLKWPGQPDLLLCMA